MKNNHIAVHPASYPAILTDPSCRDSFFIASRERPQTCHTMMIGRIPLRVISAARKASVTRANAGNDVAMPYRGTATRNNIADARCANGFLSSQRFASTDKDGKSNDGSSSSRAPLKPKESQTNGSSLRVGTVYSLNLCSRFFS